MAFDAVINDHPEFFWVGSNIEVMESGWDGLVNSYRVEATVPAGERDAVRGQLEAAADACIAQIPEDAGTYERIRYVYEYLIDTTEYDAGASQSQNIQSALLGHASVCAGYARSFQYILHRMGMFCTYVTGSIVTGGDHAWNIVRIDDQYYNVDVTWGDPIFIGMEEGETPPNMTDNYLCCTDVDLLRTHIPDITLPLPSCTDDSYNYYRISGQYYEYFDYDAVYMALMNSVWEERAQVSMKFGSYEAYQSAVYELFSNGMLHDPANYLMEIYGLRSLTYNYHTDDDFYVITIYWR